MAELKFVEVASEEQIATVSKMAYELWTAHYKPPMCSVEQTVYMLDTFQSRAAIAQQIAHYGYRYFLVYAPPAAEPVGYLATCPMEDAPHALCLSKLYLASSARGKGYGRAMCAFVDRIARQAGCTSVQLFCNRQNPSVAAYKKLGFHIVREQDTPLGSGYFGEGYIFERAIA